MKRINLLFAFLVFVSWTNAATYLVQPGGPGAAWSGVTGTVVDLTTEAKSLNDWYATTTFSSSDQIWIIKGTYTLTDLITTQYSEKIYGGFAGTEQSIGDRVKGTNAWDFTNETIIDGNVLVRGFVSTTGATIDGLSIQNCMYAGVITDKGTAAEITNSSILQNCIIRNNTTSAINSAGGVYLTSNGKLLNSYIHHNSGTNTAHNGGGVFITQLATVDGCTISNNTAYNAGGGVNIIAKTGGALVNNCIISNNTATNGNGGGLSASGGVVFTAGLSLTISNCTITSNTAKINGGGIGMDVTNGTANETNPVNILNCIISSNTAIGTTGSTGNGGGLWLHRAVYNVNGCTISNNVSTANTTTDNNGGGGIFSPYSTGTSLTVSNSVLRGNRIGSGKNAGSAINTDLASTTIRNCLIISNIGVNLHVQGGGRQCTYQNCTIAENVNLAGGEAAIYLGWQVSKISTFTNCIFYKSSTNPISGTINANMDPVVTYCGFDVAVPTTYVNKTGCITGLTSVAFTDAANGDWSLSPTSAAINAGTTIPAVTTDITGTNLRPQGTNYDIGAYEKLSAISSFTPTSGITGTTATITGTNFTGATAVSFGGTAASSFTVDSDTQITAVVGSGGTGNVSVTTPAGISTLAGFTFGAPTISGFTPSSAGNGIAVVITGTNLTGATAVSFCGTAASSFTVNSATQITAIVSLGTTGAGSVSVTTPAGTVSKSTFTWVAAPTITSFTPTNGGSGTTVVITGTNLSNATAVSFGGTAATSITVNSATQITAVVGSGAIGSVSVTTPGGTDAKAGFTSAPTITSFTPTTAGNTISVVITGTFLTGATAVTFGGTAATSITVNSASQITATVGSGASGDVTVTTPFGTATKTGFLTISSFTPTKAGKGISVVITGTNLLFANSVKFGGTAATSFTVNSDTQITATVGTGTTGSVSVVTPTGTALITNFTWVAAPTISSFTPTIGGSGTSVVITGTNLLNATAVSFGGTPATSFVVNTATKITAVVGSGATGVVSVTTPGGTGTLAGFTWVAAPTISSFTPTSAGNGSSVVIAGANFTGATTVKFGVTVATSFVVNSDTQITAVVAAGTTGNVSVTTLGGTATKTGFTWVAAPTITSFTPTSGINGTSVVITGTNLTGAIAVSFGGTATSSFIVNSATKITAVVGSGSNGSVSVITPGGTATLAGFTIAAPTITSFTPTSAGNGTSVVITGTNLTGATAVSFGGMAATSYVVNSVTQITAVVAAGTSGSISVTTAGGTVTLAGFTWVAAPTISSFTPTSGINGTSVVITGTNLTGATAVSFGGTAATSFVVNSDIQITATVDTGTTGSVSVTTPGGIATQTGFVWLEAPQSVSTVQNSSALTLTSGSIVNVVNGGELTINGNTSVNSITVERGGKLTVSDNQMLTVNGDFNINSDANGTGTFVDANSTGGLTINGTANVQQYLTGKTGTSTRAYWYLSSPVSAATSGVFNVAGTINKLTYYDETIPGYVTQLATNDVTLTKGVGYVTYIGGADAAYTFSTNTGAANAKLNTGTITLAPTRTGTSAGKRGFNLVGNPYPSFLDWNAVVKTNMSSTIWYRSYTGSVMQFDTFDGTYGTGLGVNGAVSQYIPPMQAFWVRVSADGLSGSLVLNNAMRSHQNQNQVNRLRAPSTQHSTVLRLKVSNGVNGDEALVVANPDATDGLDTYDSPKMANDNANIPEIYTMAGNEEIVINNLGGISVGKELALGFRTGASNTFTIKATQVSNFDTDTKIILKDNLLTSEQDITDGTAYSFISDATDTSTRFSLLFKSKSGTNGVDKNADASLTMYIYKNATNQIVINCNESMGTQGMVIVSNSLGQKLVQTSTTGTSTVISKSFGSGVYFITVNLAGKNSTKKIIIN